MKSPARTANKRKTYRDVMGFVFSSDIKDWMPKVRRVDNAHYNLGDFSINKVVPLERIVQLRKQGLIEI